MEKQNVDWSRIDLECGDVIELNSGDREGLLELIRKAGREKRYEVDIPANSSQKGLFQAIILKQEFDKIDSLLIEAFGKESNRHSISHIDRLDMDEPERYRIVIYNLGPPRIENEFTAIGMKGDWYNL